MKKTMTIAVDFDGVLNASPFPQVGVLVAGAKQAMEELKAMGHTLIIWTCREGQDQTDAINFLLERGVPFDGINCNTRANKDHFQNDCRKVYADLYIDDKCVGGWQGWKAVMEYITSKERR